MPEHPSDYYLLVNPGIKISGVNCERVYMISLALSFSVPLSFILFASFAGPSADSLIYVMYAERMILRGGMPIFPMRHVSLDYTDGAATGQSRAGY